MIGFDALRRALEDVLGEATVVQAGERRAIARVALALEPSPALADWVTSARIDAVVLHRHWRGLAGWPTEVVVLASHDGFDRRFGFGDSPELRHALTLGDATPLTARDGFPLGTVADAGALTAAALRDALVREFGGIEAELPAAELPAAELSAVEPQVARDRPRAHPARVATARAMTAALVDEAADLGACMYVTGQLRRPAVDTAGRRGVHVFAIGHRRSERWGLARLADCLRALALPIEVVVAPDDVDQR